jgi:hypothetical protein
MRHLKGNVQEFLNAKINFAEFLNAIFSNDGVAMKTIPIYI